MSESLQERLARSREERLAKTASADPPAGTEFSEHVPDAEYTRSDDDKKLDTVINSVDIVTGYRKWINKSQIKDGVRAKEGIKVSCPVPGHQDSHPSAWLNTDKNVWYCGSCNIGGDVYDLAAFYHGMPVPGYKEGENFHNLRRLIAMDFGYAFTTVPGSKVPVLIEPEGTPEPPPAAAPPTLSVVPDVPTPPVTISETAPDDDEAEVVSLFGDELLEDEPTLIWGDIIPAGTFLDKYMTITTRDDVAEEFHFWNAMTALGFAVGRRVTAFDRIPVLSNLFICTLGDTGSGKSQAKYHLNALLDAALPFDPTDPFPTGAKIVRGSASAEALIMSFEHRVMDPSKPKVLIATSPIMGLIEYNEMSALTGRAARTGNILKPVLLDFYDGASVISTNSAGGGTREARGAFASAHTTTQPKLLNKLVHQDDSDSGFLNRWFFASGRSKRRVSVGGEIIDIGPAVFPLQAIRTYYHDDLMLPWDTDALELFDTFYHDVIEKVKKEQDASGLLARLDLFYKKMILLFAVNMMRQTIPIEAVQQMIACHDYVMSCYRVPSAKLKETSFSVIEDDITRFCLRRRDQGKEQPKAGELIKELKRKGHRLDMIERVIKTMVNTGLLSQDQVNAGGRGRPTVRYSLASR